MKHAMHSLFRKKAPVSAEPSESERRLRAGAEALAIRSRGAAIARRTALIWTREDLASGETALSMAIDGQPHRHGRGPCQPPPGPA